MVIAVLIDAWLPFFGGGQKNVLEITDFVNKKGKNKYQIRLFHGFSANILLQVFQETGCFINSKCLNTCIKNPVYVELFSAPGIKWSGFAIIILEHHSEEESLEGKYNKGNWLRNYVKLFQPFAESIKVVKISPELWGGDWGRLGNIIEVVLSRWDILIRWKKY